MKRKSNPLEIDKFERDLKFLQLVNEHYEKVLITSELVHNWKKIDACLSKEAISQRIQAVMSACM